MSRRRDTKSHLTDFIRRLGCQSRRGSQSTQAGEESGFNDGSGRYALHFSGPVVLANAPTRGQSFLPRRRVVSTSKSIDDDYEEGRNEEMPPLDDDNNVRDPSHKHPRSDFDNEEEECDVMGDAEKRLHQRQRRQRQQQRSGGVGPHGGGGLENSPSPRGSAPSESSVCDAFDDSVSGRTTSRVDWVLQAAAEHMNTSAPLIFDVPPMFKVESIIGQGSYGAVCKALYGGDQVAIKKIPNYVKSEETLRRVLREIEILQNLQFCDQVVGCRLLFRPTSQEKDVYVVMDYIPSDLSTVVKNSSITLSENIIRYITCQLLLALRAVHRAKVLHRDVSSRNILINYNSQIFICDFGLSRFFDPDEQLSFGVVTQWYRAPEIILDAEYDAANDVWSVGVILCELLLRRHLFPGKCNDSADQLNIIFHLVGTPPASVFNEGQPFARASVNAKKYVLSVIETRPRKSMLRELLMRAPILQNNAAGVSPIIDLAERLLSFSPRDRPTADEALKHPWFEPCRAFIDDMILAQDEQRIDPQFSSNSSLSMQELIRKIEELVPIFSEQLLETDDA